MALATFAMGCFWSPELVFSKLPGVTGTAVGYMGGRKQNPTYNDVCSDTTNHAEVVHIQFDPKEVSFSELLMIFWTNHNPTTRNRQGPDIGSQYRSVIFYHDEEQKTIAQKSMKEQQEKYANPITTEIVPAMTFWKAEEYHQQYLRKRGQESCGI